MQALRNVRVASVVAACATLVPFGAGAFGQSAKVFNFSFEQPVVSSSTGVVVDPSAADQGAGPGDSAWVFAQGSGIAVGGASLGPVVVPPPPDGKQVGYFDTGGDFQQKVNFPADGNYVLEYQEAGNAIYTVFLDDAAIVPAHLTPSAFAPRSSDPFSVSAGPHTLEFRDTDPREIAGPLPGFFDAVTVVPEPSTVALICAALLTIRQRRRSPIA